MKLVPQLGAVAFASLALAGLTQSAFAGGLMPGNGGPIVLPSVLPPSVRDSLLSASSSSGLEALGQRLGVQGGHLDFFSTRPSDDGGFKPLLRGGVGDGGLQLQLKW
jgi:hypothetical protein